MTIADDADDELLPALITSGLATTALTQIIISDVLHDALHHPCCTVLSRPPANQAQS